MIQLFLRIFKFSPGKSLLLTVLTLLSSALEGLGVTIVVPVIGFLIGKDNFPENNLTRSLIQVTQYLGLEFSMEVMLGFMIFIFFVKSLVATCAKYIVTLVGVEFTYSFQTALLRSIPKTIYTSFLKKNAGELVSAMVNDPASSSYALTVATNMLSNLILFLIYFIVLLQISWKLTLLTFFAAAVLILPFRFVNRKASTYGYRRVKENDYVTGRIVEFITKIKYYLTSSKLNNHFEELEKSFLSLKDLTFRTSFFSNLYAIISQPFTIILVSLILVWSKRFQISFDLLVLFILSFIRIPPLVFQVQSFGIDLHNLYPSFDKIINLLNFFSTNARSQGPEKVNLEGPFELEFQNVSYSIQGKLIVEIPKLKIQSEKVYYIMGESGGGKSTFIDLIMGLRPDYEGHIHVKNVELRNLDNDAWKSQIAYVTQDPIVWNASIQDNILEYSQMDQSRYDLVLEGMGCTSFIDSFESKDKTIVSDTANNMSGGQKQRIALARAFFSRAPIVLLDEVTSALDSLTEEGIINGIRNLSKAESKTVFFVTHRKAFIKEEDTVIHFDKGKITFFGSFQEFKKVSNV